MVNKSRIVTVKVLVNGLYIYWQNSKAMNTEALLFNRSAWPFRLLLSSIHRESCRAHYTLVIGF